MPRLGQEVWECASVKLGLAQLAGLEEVLASALEVLVEDREEAECLGRQDGRVSAFDLA